MRTGRAGSYGFFSALRLEVAGDRPYLIDQVNRERDMSSPIEQLVSNFNWAAWRKAHTLKGALLFLLIAFIAMRFGTHIPLPGIDRSAWQASPWAQFGSWFN